MAVGKARRPRVIVYRPDDGEHPHGRACADVPLLTPSSNQYTNTGGHIRASAGQGSIDVVTQALACEIASPRWLISASRSWGNTPVNRIIHEITMAAAGVTTSDEIVLGTIFVSALLL
jgi:hypothetical protein